MKKGIEWESVDKWGYLCYIGAGWYGNTIQFKDILLAQAIEEKRAETERAIRDYGKLGGTLTES